MRCVAIVLVLGLLAACGAEGAPEPVPGGVGLSGARIQVVGGI